MSRATIADVLEVDSAWTKNNVCVCVSVVYTETTGKKDYVHFSIKKNIV